MKQLRNFWDFSIRSERFWYIFAVIEFFTLILNNATIEGKILVLTIRFFMLLFIYYIIWIAIPNLGFKK